MSPTSWATWQRSGPCAGFLFHCYSHPYDAASRLLTTTRPNGTVETRAYDGFGQLTDVVTTDPNDNTIAGFTYGLDADGRRASETDLDGRATDYTYDPDGRLTEADVYLDGHTPGTNAPDRTYTYAYDLAGNRVGMTDSGDGSSASDLTYTYDGLGRLHTVKGVRRDGIPLTTPETTTYTYDLLGNLAREDRPDGTVVTYRYDQLNRLFDLTQYAPDSTPDELDDNPKQADYAYELNDDGSRHQETQTLWFGSDGDGTPEPHTSTTTWTYDDLGRLKEWRFGQPRSLGVQYSDSDPPIWCHNRRLRTLKTWPRFGARRARLRPSRSMCCKRSRSTTTHVPEPERLDRAHDPPKSAGTSDGQIVLVGQALRKLGPQESAEIL